MSTALLHPFVERASPLHAINPGVKLGLLVLLPIAAALTPTSAWWAYAGYFALVIGAWSASGVSLRSWLAPLTLPAIPIALAILLLPLIAPSEGSWVMTPIPGLRLSGAGCDAALTLALRAGLTLLAVGVLVTSTRPEALFGATARVSPGLARNLALMWRFFHIFVEELMRMRRAALARAYRPRGLWQVGAIGRVVASLFLRAYARSERVERAMRARSGDVRALLLEPAPMGRRDRLVLLLGAIAILVLMGSAR